jgi:tetratricopeptide (TPR) repeat protein
MGNAKMVKHATNTSLFIVSSVAREERRQKSVYELLHLAEHARLARDFGLLETAVNGISKVWLSRLEQEAANYFSGFLTLVKGDSAQAKRLLESAAEGGSSYFRARAMTGLAAISLRTGDYRLADEFYNESYLVSRKESTDSVRWYIYKDRCVLRSMLGDHKGAARLLEEGLPAARFIGLHHPGFFLDYLNSLAVEYNELGRIKEATEVMRPVARSPLIHNFPTWQETLMEIEDTHRSASRSVVIVPNEVEDGHAKGDNRILDFCDYVSHRRMILPSDRRLVLIGHLLNQYPMSLTLTRTIIKLVDDDGKKSDILNLILKLI